MWKCMSSVSRGSIARDGVKPAEVADHEHIHILLPGRSDDLLPRLQREHDRNHSIKVNKIRDNNHANFNVCMITVSRLHLTTTKNVLWQ